MCTKLIFIVRDRGPDFYYFKIAKTAVKHQTVIQYKRAPFERSKPNQKNNNVSQAFGFY